MSNTEIRHQACPCSWGDRCKHYQDVLEQCGDLAKGKIIIDNHESSLENQELRSCIKMYLGKTSQKALENKTKYAVARHHWNRDLLAYVDKGNSIDKPVDTELARKFGIDQDDNIFDRCNFFSGKRNEMLFVLSPTAREEDVKDHVDILLDPSRKKRRTSTESKKMQAETGAVTTVTAVDVELPCTEKCMETFDRLDFNRTGLLSLAELNQAVVEIWPDFNHKCAIMRAYKTSDLNGDGFIGRSEFEIFLGFLAFYNNLWHDFDSVDIDDDHRLSKEEFVAAASRLRISNAEETFEEMDVNGDGYVVFDEFCSWMAQHTLKKKISVGASFSIAYARSARALESYREKEQTYISRLFLDLRCSIDMLKAKATDGEIESWAIMIHNCMSSENRAYHGIPRIFEMSNGANPIQMIAIYFHDIVYYHFDGGLSPMLTRLLDGILDEKNDDVISEAFDLNGEPHVAMVMSIFGLSPGDWVDPRALNKFLSAAVCVRVLQDAMSMTQLAKIIVCMKAVVDHDDRASTAISTMYAGDAKTYTRLSQKFFGKETLLDEKLPQSPADNALDTLYARLTATNECFQLDMKETTVVKAIQRAADVVNRGRGIFAAEDAAPFLDQLWSLLPELTPALRETKLYTVYDFHKGIKNLERFLSVLDHRDIFVSFRGVPDAREIASFKRKSARNMEVAKTYVSSKAVSLSVIAAFAELTGGDAPMSLLMGDRPSERRRSDQLGDDLPELAPEALEGCNEFVYHALSEGRKEESSFDIRKSPVTAFVYGMLGDDGVHNALKYTDYPMEKDRARVLLSSLPQEVVFPIGKAFAKIAVSRTEVAEDVLKDLTEKYR